MREYCLNRLENVNNNLTAIIRRLKKLKPKKIGKKRLAAAKSPTKLTNADFDRKLTEPFENESAG